MTSHSTATDEQRAAAIAALEAEGDGYEQRAKACKAAGETEEAEKYAARSKSVQESVKAWKAGGSKAQTRPRGSGAQTRDAGPED